MSGLANRFKQPLLPMAHVRNEPIGVLSRDEEDELAKARSEFASKSGHLCKTMVMSAGAFGLLCVIALGSVFIWRAFVFQDDITRLNNRLIAAEALLVNHTGRLGALNTTLITTIGRVTVNEVDILALQLNASNHEDRIRDLENRTTLLEGRMTAAEITILAIIQNVTVLQSEVLAIQLDLVTIHADILALQLNASNHEDRIQALETQTAQNVADIALLFQYLQGNLTVIDSRLDALNTTYTVSASGFAQMLSGPSEPVAMAWQTRRFTATGGLDVEYLWIAGVDPEPYLLLQMDTPSNGYSFRIGNFTSTTPVPPLTDPLLAIDRPLSAYQRSKFAFLTSVPDAAVWSATWNNTDVSLNFKSNLIVLDAVTLLTPITFVIGFL
jgi:hypothetical protein